MVYMHFVYHIVDGMVASTHVDDVRYTEIRAQFRGGAKEATGVVCGGRYRKQARSGRTTEGRPGHGEQMAAEFNQAFDQGLIWAELIKLIGPSAPARARRV